MQNNLDAIINKKMSELSIEVDYITDYVEPKMLFRYSVTLGKDAAEKYVIASESLTMRKATSSKDDMVSVFKVMNGEVLYVSEADEVEFIQQFLKKTTNLLSNSSMCSLFLEKVLLPGENFEDERNRDFIGGSSILFLFATSLHTCIEQSDDHSSHVAQRVFERLKTKDSDGPREGRGGIDDLIDNLNSLWRIDLDAIEGVNNIIPQSRMDVFEQSIRKLCDFIRIFKADLREIEIDKKIDKDVYVCDLIMVYDSCKIHAEYESTGIKKLIRLYAYLQKMVEGGIVFIDEFDSNLHDVYLCALLEYLMEYGEGQLCFTTHNVGPMDVLKQHKKSIDFLSVDHKVYSWKTNGNYSPAKLYRNGMIEGSPFNVDSIDFIGVFGSKEEGE